jgi:hypothetical protein
MILRHEDNLRGADNSSPRLPSPSAHGGAVEPECRYLRVGQQGQRGCGARDARGRRRCRSFPLRELLAHAGGKLGLPK